MCFVGVDDYEMVLWFYISPDLVDSLDVMGTRLISARQCYKYDCILFPLTFTATSIIRVHSILSLPVSW